MHYKIVVTDTAKQDLRNIVLYIAEESKNKDIASDFVNELRAKTKVLEAYPNSGAIPDDRVLKSLGYRFLVHKDYMLFYLVNETQKIIYIIAIFNSKRDYVRAMMKFI